MKVEEIFDKYIVDKCEEHDEPVVFPTSLDIEELENKTCLTCIGKKEIPAEDFSELIEKWEGKLIDYIKRIILNKNLKVSFEKIIADVFNYRNESFGIFGKELEIKTKALEIGIDPFIQATYLLNLISSFVTEPIELLSSQEDYSLEALQAPVEYLFILKYAEHLVHNGLRKVSLIPAEEISKDSPGFYKTIVENNLCFDKDGKKYWYESYDLPVTRKIYRMMRYYGGHNKSDIVGQDESEELLPDWTSAIAKLEEEGIKQEIKGITNQKDGDDIKTLLVIGGTWYPIISPNIFHANLFDTRFLQPMKYLEMHKLFKFLGWISKKNNVDGIFIIPIANLFRLLKDNEMGELLNQILSKMVLFYPRSQKITPPKARSRTKKFANIFMDSKRIYERVTRNFSLQDLWIDEKIFLGYYTQIEQNNNIQHSIAIDHTILPFYAAANILYSDKYGIQASADGDFFEKEIVPYYISNVEKKGYEYIRSESVEAGIKRIPDVSSNEIQIDGILIDKVNKKVYVVETKTISPDKTDVISKRSISIMAMKFLVEVEGKKLGKIERGIDEIPIEEKKHGSSMKRRTEIVRDNWDEMELEVDIKDIKDFDFRPMIITNVPAPLSEKTIQDLGFPILSLHDIMHKFPDILTKIS